MQCLCNPWCSNLYAPDIHEHPHVWYTPLNMIVCDPLSDWWVRTQGAWTDSSNFSCYYQCQLLTKLNPVVVFDVVAHTKRLNASIVCCRYYFDWSVFIQSSYRVNVNDVKRFFCRIDLSIDLYLLTDFDDFHIDSGRFLDSELIENIFEFVRCTVFVLFMVIAK